MIYYEISNDLWRKLEQVFPIEGFAKGDRPSRDKREFINAIVLMLRTGAPWRALPAAFGSWCSVYSRFRRWQKKGFWKTIFQVLSAQADLESVMIDETYIHAHQHAAGAKEGSKNRLWAVVAEALRVSST